MVKSKTMGVIESSDICRNVRGLPVLRLPGIVPCIFCLFFTRQFRCFLV